MRGRTRGVDHVIHGRKDGGVQVRHAHVTHTPRSRPGTMTDRFGDGCPCQGGQGGRHQRLRVRWREATPGMCDPLKLVPAGGTGGRGRSCQSAGGCGAPDVCDPLESEFGGRRELRALCDGVRPGRDDGGVSTKGGCGRLFASRVCRRRSQTMPPAVCRLVFTQGGFQRVW